LLRLFSTIQKEMLILWRDKGGLAIMFLMPMVLIIIMALIQDAPFRDFQELKIPLLLKNNDSTGALGNAIEEGLKKSKIFELTDFTGAEKDAKKNIANGKFQIGIVIPSNASAQLNNKVDQFVSKTVAGLGLNQDKKKEINEVIPDLNIEVYFAPDVKNSFKSSVLSSLKQFSSKLETQTLLDYFSKELNQSDSLKEKSELKELVNFIELDAAKDTNDKILGLNSVQHNVPAWTMFGMFFIVISMAGSIIKERDDGSYLRIRTMPGSYIHVLAGKISAYLLICVLQCVLMLLVGIYLLPLLGLPKLVIGSSISAIAVITISSGLAATGYGVMIGSLFNTHQQSSTFGAISVVILAALGGIWVPVYVMPEAVRALAEYSPLYWGLNAFQDIFLRSGTVQTILPYALKLLVFFGFTIGIAYFFNKFKKSR